MEQQIAQIMFSVAVINLVALFGFLGAIDRAFREIADLRARVDQVDAMTQLLVKIICDRAEPADYAAANINAGDLRAVS